MKTNLTALFTAISLTCATICTVCVYTQDRTPEYYNMSHAKQVVYNVDAFDIQNPDGETADVYLNGNLVEIDADINQAELFYLKEEIVVRIAGHRVSIISGDNGQF